VRVPGMLFAVVARAPTLGGKVISFDPESVRGAAGVRAVVQIDSGVTVVADSTWHAIQARKALKVQWENGSSASLSSDSIRTQLLGMLEDAKAALAKPAAPPEQVFEATYEVPYLAHATMEPMNATADVRGDRCEVWAPTQDRQLAQRTAMKLTGLPAAAVEVHVPQIGGGMGRRLMVDYVAEAVQVSKVVSAPVQVMWTREDDLQHDYYRPVSYHYLRVEAGMDGIPHVWRHLIATQRVPGAGDITEGARDLPYSIGQISVQALEADLAVPVGCWRSGFRSQNAFVTESFLDEVGVATHQDPLGFRLRILDEKSPLRPVLDAVQKRARWGTPFIGPGRFRGLACHIARGQTAVAMIAEVIVSKEGQVQVPKVLCAVDCGTAVNPDTISAQIEGGIVFGLTGVLKGQVTVKDGRIEQANLNDFPLPTMADAPEVDVNILASDRPPSGVGEVAVPVIVPAVTNGVFAATRKWIRRLPIRPEDCKS
ncbi:MAG: xanthine dehydrogenase family protein molybdopterin-binding subunit, partial [Rudaea sp.]